MKISQEVREFAANNPNGVLGDLALSPEGRGLGEGAITPEDAEAGMAQMAETFKDKGGELYVEVG